VAPKRRGGHPEQAPSGSICTYILAVHQKEHREGRNLSTPGLVSPWGHTEHTPHPQPTPSPLHDAWAAMSWGQASQILRRVHQQPPFSHVGRVVLLSLDPVASIVISLALLGNNPLCCVCGLACMRPILKRETPSRSSIDRVCVCDLFYPQDQMEYKEAGGRRKSPAKSRTH
jgi:hypothetical protein